MNIKISDDELIGLIEKAKEGDTRAFEKIVVSFQRYSYAVSFRILCSSEDAEEIVQESFIRIWKNLKSFDSNSRFTTWMYKIVVNLCYDRLRSRKRFRRSEGDPELSVSQLTGSTDLEREFSEKETVALIKYFSNGLSEKQKIIFVLRDLEEFSVKEVSDITGMSQSAVKTNLFFARQNIRKKIIGLEK